MSSIIIVAIILIILLIIVILINYNINEGFVTFAQETPKGELVSIPQYSSTSKVLKLYDNLFFDIKNGNIIEVDSTTYKNGVSSDKTGTTISNIHIITRTSGGLVKDYITAKGANEGVKPVDTEESKISTISLSNKSWSYITKCVNTDTYQLFYFPCGVNTFIHIINITKSKKLIPFSVLSFVITNSNNLSYEINTSNTLTQEPSNTDSSSNSPISNLSKLIKVGINSYFDKVNGNLVLVSPSYLSTSPIGDGTNGAIVISRSSNGTGRENYLADNVGVGTITSITNTWVTSGDKELLVYFAKEQDTSIAVIIPDMSNTIANVFKIENIKHFNANGETSCTISNDKPKAESTPEPAQTPSKTTDTSSTTKTPDENDFYKWYYWVSMSNLGSNGKDFGINNTSHCDKCSNNSCQGCSGSGNNGGNAGGTSSGSGGGSGNTGGNAGGTSSGGGNGAPSSYYTGGSIGHVTTVGGGNNEYIDIKTLDKGVQYGVNKIGQGVQYGVNTAGQGVQYGVNTAGQGVQYGVNTAGQSVQYGVNTAGQSVQYGVDTTGKGVEYGVNTVGSGIEYAVDKTGSFLNTALDKTGNAFKYLIEREDRLNGRDYQQQSMMKNGMGGNGMGGNGQPPNYFENPEIYQNANGPMNPTFLPITSDFSAFGR